MAYWGMQPTEDATFNLLLTSSASYEDTAWFNEEFDELVRRGRSTADPAERAAIYAKAQEIQLRDTPYIIAMYQDVLTASRDWVMGWTVHPLNRVFFVEDVWLDRG